MTPRKTLLIAAVLSAFAAAPLSALSAGPGPARPAAALVPLASVEIADLTFMREEEKVARDLYLAFDLAWGTPPFAAIASAEQFHMNAILRHLVRYSLPDPTTGREVGEYANGDLQAMHDELLEKGLASELGAVQVGGLVEEVDIEDNESAVARTIHPEIANTYESLACGSRNHLRAFAAATSAITGSAYAAQYLAQARVDAILKTPWERCGR